VSVAWPGALESGEDPAILPGIPAPILAALDRWRKKDSSAETWDELTKRLPLDPGLQTELSEHETEKRLSQDIHYIRNVCEKPNTHLKADEQREPVARVRRITTRTVQHLAAHSEDWHAQTFRGVRPSRLLAQVTEENWALYENRAVVTLQRYVSGSLSRRVVTLRSLLAQLEQIEAPDNLMSGSRFRRERMFELWGNAFKNPPNADAIRALYDKLNDLLRDVRALLSSRLFREARNFAPVRPPLRSTNLFRGNDAYRHVESLWRMWMEKADAEKTISEDEWLQKRRNRIQAHRDLVCTLTLRSLSKFRIQNDNLDSPIHQPLLLIHDWKLHRLMSGLLTLKKAEINKAHILPVADSRNQHAVDIHQALRAEPLGEQNAPILCVWLDSDLENPESTLSSESEGAQIRHIYVSPQRMDSGEGVLRFVREIIYHEEWPLLPLIVDLPLELNSIIRDYLPPLREGGLVTPPSETKLKKAVAERTEADTELKLAENEIERLEEQKRKALRKNQPIRELENRRQKLKARLDQQMKRREDLNAIVVFLERTIATFTFAQRCPCCPSDRAEITNSRFCCTSCNTEWGRDRKTGSVFIWPKNRPSLPKDSPDWEADYICPGCDRSTNSNLRP